jgi:hypothetical protein
MLFQRTLKSTLFGVKTVQLNPPTTPKMQLSNPVPTFKASVENRGMYSFSGDCPGQFYDQRHLLLHPQMEHNSCPNPRRRTLGWRFLTWLWGDAPWLRRPVGARWEHETVILKRYKPLRKKIIPFLSCISLCYADLAVVQVGLDVG